jgi:WD40 repeat protein
VGFLASSSPDRLFLMRHDRRLQLWRLAPEDPASLTHEQVPALEIKAAGTGNIIAAALSPNGQLLAYSTATDLRILSLSAHGQPPKKVRSSLSGRAYVTALAFSPDSTRLLAGTDRGTALLCRLKGGEGKEEEEPAESDFLAQDDDREEWGGSAVLSLSWSFDGGRAAAACLDGSIHVLATTPGSKSLAVEWRLPRLDSAPSAMAFHPSAAVLVVAAVRSNRLYMFDVARRDLTDWCKDVGDRMPEQITGRSDCIIGLCFNPATPSSVMMHGFGFLAQAHLDRPVARDARITPDTHPQAVALRERRAAEQAMSKWRARKRGGNSSNAKGGEGGKAAEHGQEGEWTAGAVSNMTVHLGYQGMVAVAAMGPDEILVVEEPWIKIVDKLPTAVSRNTYGK